MSRQTLGPHFSEGARLLWRWIEINHAGSMSEGQRAIGSARGLMSRWLYGDTRPGVKWALEIKRLAGIPLEAWTQRPKRAFVPPALRAA